MPVIPQKTPAQPSSLQQSSVVDSLKKFLKLRYILPLVYLMVSSCVLVCHGIWLCAHFIGIPFIPQSSLQNGSNEVSVSGVTADWIGTPMLLYAAYTFLGVLPFIFPVIIIRAFNYELYGQVLNTSLFEILFVTSVISRYMAPTLGYYLWGYLVEKAMDRYKRR